jgi:hypothetical protein
VLGQELYRLQKIMLNHPNNNPNAIMNDDPSLNVLPWEESVIILGMHQ